MERHVWFTADCRSCGQLYYLKSRGLYKEASNVYPPAEQMKVKGQCPKCNHIDDYSGDDLKMVVEPVPPPEKRSRLMS